MSGDQRLVLDYRTTPEQIRAQYRDAEAAFCDGNFSLALQWSTDPELRGCAYIRMGFAEIGIELLEKCDRLSARGWLHRALADWFMDKTDQCRERLLEVQRTAKGDEALKQLVVALIDCLGREHIDVVLQASELTLDVEEFAPPSFRIHRLGYHEGDIPLRPTMGPSHFQKELKRRNIDDPLCVVVIRPEYDNLFDRFDQLPLFKVAFISDYDFHLSQKFDEMSSFDAYFVLGPVEHAEARQIFKRPTDIFVTTAWHYTDNEFRKGSRRPKADRHYDLLITGSTLHPLFRDKSKIIAAMLNVDDRLQVLANDGHMASEAYCSLLADARLVPTYDRKYGTLPGRGIEALLYGASVLEQAGSMLEFVFPPDGAELTPYKTETFYQDLQLAIGRSQIDLANVLHHPHIAPLLDPRVQLNRLLKLAVFRALGHQTAQATERMDRKPALRHRRQVGPERLPPHPILEAQIEWNRTLPPSVESLTSAASSNFYYFRCLPEGTTDPKRAERFAMAGDDYRRAIALAPNRAAPRFNLARIEYHFGDRLRARTLFEELWARRETLQLDPLRDDLLSPIHFAPEEFPYGDYCDATTRGALGRPQPAAPIKILLSGCTHYCAKLASERNDFNQAVVWGERAVQEHSRNFIAQLSLVRALDAQRAVGYQEKIIRCYKQALEEFPLCILDTAVALFVDALAAVECWSEVEAVLDRWYRFYRRVRRRMGLLPIDRRLSETLARQSKYLPEPARKIIALQSGAAHLGKLPPFEEELLVRLVIARGGGAEFYRASIAKGLPLRVESYVPLAQHLTAIGETEAGNRCYLEALRRSPPGAMSPELAEVHRETYAEASRLKSLGDFDTSFEFFCALEASQGGQRWGILFHLGELYLGRGDTTRAIHCFEECLRELPAHRKSREHLERLGRQPCAKEQSVS